jgi:hypothetical protein
MTRISRIAIKTPSGKVKTAPIGKHHIDLGATRKDVRGFIADGKFVGHSAAAKIADKSHQIKKPVKKLHSSNLK